jgi:phage gp36-like protein
MYATNTTGYCTIEDLMLRYGRPNLVMWAALEGQNCDHLIPQRWQSAIDWATAQINSLLMRSGYAIPLQFGDIYAQEVVRDWCVHLAVNHLYTARGHLDEDKSEGKFEEDRKRVMAEIMRVRSGSMQFNAARRWGDNPTVPTII